MCVATFVGQRTYVFKAHRLLYHSTLGLRVIKKRRSYVFVARFPRLFNVAALLDLELNVKVEPARRALPDDFCDVPAHLFGRTRPVLGKRFGPQGVDVRPLSEGFSLIRLLGRSREIRFNRGHRFAQSQGYDWLFYARSSSTMAQTPPRRKLKLDIEGEAVR